MRIITTLVILSFMPISIFAQDLNSDTLAVRAILDSNGLNNISVDEVTYIKNGRVVTFRIEKIKKFTKVPGSELSKLTGLTTFWCIDCSLDTLPDEIGNMHLLGSIKIEGCGLKYLPPTIASCPLLKDLYLRKNELKTLPKDIGNLKNLMNLEAYRNKITHIPESIVNCPNLISIYLARNEISSMPDNFHRLPKVAVVEIEYNKIEALPDSIGYSPGLSSFLVHGNLLTTLPKSIIYSSIEKFNVRFNCIDRRKLDPAVREWADKQDPFPPDWWTTQTPLSISTNEKNINKKNHKEFIKIKNGRKPGFSVLEKMEFSLAVFNSMGKTILKKQVKKYEKGFYSLFEKNKEPVKGKYLIKFTKKDGYSIEKKITVN